MMRIHTYTVNGLDEYMGCIRDIANRKTANKNAAKPPILWFRGVTDYNHTLTPSLLRSETRVKRIISNADYSSLHYAEDIRTQHYIAKNDHFFKNRPSSRVEWLEVMQHHEMATRVLDWSESSVHSLIFSVEPFLDNKRYHSPEREVCVPCVWVLEPGKLNKGIYEWLVETYNRKPEILESLLSELQITDANKREILSKIFQRNKMSLFNETKETAHIDYILNLSVINDELLRDRSRITALLQKGDIINPFHYLLARIYSDGHILENRELPPLAVVQPYHSERIKEQKGVFTVFPFYEERFCDEKCRSLGINPDAMENNAIAEPCLHKIIINKPQKVAYELLLNGMGDAWLYPEMPIVVNGIERHEVYS